MANQVQCNSDIGVHILALSADDRATLKRQLGDLSAKFAKDAPGDLDTPAEQARKSRRQFDPRMAERLVLVWEEKEDPVVKIEAALKLLTAEDVDEEKMPDDIFYGHKVPPGRIAFLFPGQGSQYLHMGRRLLRDLPDGRSVMDAIEPLFHRNRRMQDFIFPETASEGSDPKALEEDLRQTDVAQPGIGVVSRVMNRILSRLNIAPDAAGGHSFGELSALCAGGMLDEADFLSLAVWRGKLMAEAGAGKDRGMMLAVLAPLEKIEALLEDHGHDVILANRNGPAQGVLSGPSEAIREVKSLCKKNRMRAVSLPVSAAFHSRLVEDAALPFREKIEATDFHTGALPVYSNTTARPYPEDSGAVRAILGDHLLNPVHFIDEIRHMYADGVRTFLEVGPKTVLTGLVRAILQDDPHAAFSVDGSAGKRNSLLDVAAAVGRLAAMGYPVALQKWDTLT